MVAADGCLSKCWEKSRSAFNTRTRPRLLFQPIVNAHAMTYFDVGEIAIVTMQLLKPRTRALSLLRPSHPLLPPLIFTAQTFYF